MEPLPSPPSTPPEAERRNHRAPAVRHASPADWRYVAAVFLVVVALLIAVTGWVYSQERSRIADRQLNVLQSLSRDALRELELWRTERLDEARRFTDNEAYLRAMERQLRGLRPGPAWQTFLDDVEVLLSRRHYDAIFLLDPDGRTRFVSGRGLREGPRIDGAVEAVLRRPVPQFYAVGEGELIRIRLVTPLFDGGGEFIGLLGFQIIPQRNFSGTIVRELPIADAIAEVLVLSGDRVISPQAGMAPRATLTDRQPLRDNFFTAVDEQGREVVATEAAVEGTPWTMVTRVDAEAFGEAFQRLTLWTLGMLLLFISASGGLAYLTWRRAEARSQLREAEAQRELALLERRFDYLAKYANDAIFLADESGRIVEVNDKAVELYGYDRAALKGMEMSRLRAPETVPRFEEDWQKIDGDASVVYETVHRAADGRELPVEVSARRILVDRGHYVQSIVRDISERKRNEKRIRRQTDLYAALSRANEAIAHFTSREVLLPEICRIAVALGGYSEAHVALTDGNGEPTIVASFVRPSEAAAGAVERSASRIQGLLLTAFRESHAAIRDGAAANRPEAERTKSAAAFPLRRVERTVGAFGVVARDSEPFDEDQIRLLQDLALDLSLALENLEVDTRRRAAERLTRDNETRYRNLFENMGSGVMVMVNDGQEFVVKDLNAAMERMESLRREEVLGRTVKEVFAWATHCLLPAAEEVWRTGESKPIPAHCHEEGRRGWRESYIYRLPTDELVLVADDVTERVTAEEELRSSEERLALVLEGTNEAYWDLNFDTGELHYSPRFIEMFGYAPDEMGASLEGFQKLVHPNDAIDVQRLLADHLAGKTPQFQSEHRMRHKTRGYIWVRATGRVVRRSPDNRPVRMVGTHVDITEERSREARLRQWTTVFEQSYQAIIITDARRRIVAVNRAFTEITGYTAEEVKGRDPNVLCSGIHDRAFYQTLWASVSESGHWQGEIQDRRKNGEIFPLWLSISAAKDEQGQVQNYIAIASDMSERKEAEDRIRYLAYHDALTGLPNRALFSDRVAFAISHARRHGLCAAVLFLDLDRFEEVNDAYGHDRGDGILALVASRLRTAVRSGDTIARQGGDEFLVLLTELHGLLEAAAVAQKILADVAEPTRIDGEEVRITTSIGIALYPENGAEADTLIRNADAAMYFAKERGRNNFQFFTEDLNRRVGTRLSLEKRLRRAVEQGEFQLLYQPLVNLESGEVKGAEALLRWKTEGEMVPPSRFLPLAEESGLIVPLGEWVVREACRQQAAWKGAGLPVLPISVNVSAREFRQRGWIEGLRALVRECPAHLEMELPERLLAEDAKSQFATARALRDLGITLAVHDFGSACVSPAYLRQMPVEHLKFEQGFIRGLAGDPFIRALMDATVTMASGVGSKVTAVGVESAEEAAQLRERHCEQAQGHYFSPPLPPDQFELWWRERTDSAKPSLH